eukprot:m.405063 g.405063  ORF g.405063 m.405063 type:complete len:466 (+) comp21204_c0_seq1:229-1626(+)
MGILDEQFRLVDGKTVRKPLGLRTQLSLDAMSLTFADVQWMGPLTAIYCHHDLGFSLSETGIIMGAQYAAAVVMNPLSGIIMDNSKAKKFLMALAFCLTALTYLLLSTVKSYAGVFSIILVQSAISGMYIPGINSLSLGFVGLDGFAKRCTRNEIFRHVGVMIAGITPALVVPVHGWWIFFMVQTSVAVFAALVVLMGVDSSKIDHEAARGQEPAVKDGLKAAMSYRDVFTKLGVMMLLAAVISFHTGNAAMLPMIGDKIDELVESNSTEFGLPYLGEVDGTVGVGVLEAVTEALSIPVALLVGTFADRPGWGRRRVAIIGFTILPIRGVILASIESVPALLATSVLDAIGAATCGVVAILMAQDLSVDTGRFSTLQGAVGASIGLGSALSQVIAGFIADAAGFSTTFLALGGIALVALLIMILMKETKPELLSRDRLGTPMTESLLVYKNESFDDYDARNESST